MFHHRRHHYQQQQQLFVSPSGSDSAAGSFEQPFRTLRRAQVAARLLTPPGEGPVVINIRGGVYSARDGSVLLELTAQDSGTAKSPRIWRAYGGEDVLLSAGAHIPAASFVPRPAHPNQLQTNLTALGLVDLGNIGAQVNANGT